MHEDVMLSRDLRGEKARAVLRLSGSTSMRKLSVLLGCLLAGGLAPWAARAQDPGVIFYQHRQFKIPFKNDQRSQGVTQVRLYVSTNQGQKWQYTASAAPEEQHFRFSTPQDGPFWFAVQTVDTQGKLFPPSLEDLKANLKVVIDTLPPRVQVQALQPRQNEIGATWHIQDDNLDLGLPDAVRIEYRQVGAAAWIPLAAQGGGNQLYWNPQSNAQFEVRVLARDRAGNIGEDKTVVSLQGGGGQVFPPFQKPANQGNDAIADLKRKFVNRKQISIGYDLKEVGPSGVSSIELWYTLYKGRAWNKLTDFPIDAKNVEAEEPKRLSFEVQEEGVYGITLLAKSGVGLGERPPQPGDAPQFWIEVDLTRPAVQLLGVHVGTGVDKGKLAVAWTATDKNLGPTPIRLSYSESKEGPWTTFADKLGNTGKHVWRLPDQLPFQFYLRVEASDLAGNTGEAITFDRVKVDLSQPKAVPLDIQPGGR
jgi:hypothetical protein